MELRIAPHSRLNIITYITHDVEVYHLVEIYIGS